jgi:hypothetical protein
MAARMESFDAGPVGFQHFTPQIHLYGFTFKGASICDVLETHSVVEDFLLLEH